MLIDENPSLSLDMGADAGAMVKYNGNDIAKVEGGTVQTSPYATDYGVQGNVDEVMEVSADGKRAIKCRGTACACEVCGACLAAGTEVATPSGNRPIENLKVGDAIYGWSSELYDTVVTTVTGTQRALRDGLVQITAGVDTLRVTPEHPLYLPKLGRYLPADSLRRGMQLLALTGSLLTITDVAAQIDATQVANIEVAGVHNYFAGAGELLVHNSSAAEWCDKAMSRIFTDEVLNGLNADQLVVLDRVFGDVAVRDAFKADFEGADEDWQAFFVGARGEEVAGRVGAWEIIATSGSNGIRALRTNTGWLTRVSKWINEGVDVVDLNGTLRLRNSTAEFGRIDASGRLFPTYFDQNWYPYTGYTAIGSPKNRCQVYKSPNGVFIVSREPDLMGHDPIYVNQYLTGSKKCHALERHNYDVLDEALKYRAKYGIAPDGSKTGWNYIQNNKGDWLNVSTPPYSSKFLTAQRMQDAIDATRPPPGHTGSWNPPKYSDPNGVPFGYGYPRANSAGVVPQAVQMDSVKVIWINESGNWKVLTMYPDIP